MVECIFAGFAWNSRGAVRQYRLARLKAGRRSEIVSSLYEKKKKGANMSEILLSKKL